MLERNRIAQGGPSFQAPPRACTPGLLRCVTLACVVRAALEPCYKAVACWMSDLLGARA